MSEQDPDYLADLLACWPAQVLVVVRVPNAWKESQGSFFYPVETIRIGVQRESIKKLEHSLILMKQNFASFTST